MCDLVSFDHGRKMDCCSRLLWKILAVVLLCQESWELFAGHETKCEPGYYGWKCRFQCICRFGDPCDVRGNCRAGCPQGRYGPGCSLLPNCTYGDERGEFYMGSVSHVYEKTCINWSEVNEGFTKDSFPDKVFPYNFCRNPRGVYSTPWCFVRTKTEPYYEYNICSIKKCTCEKGRWGVNCMKECHCKSSIDCDKDVGHCLSGCAPGWTGSDCQKVCQPGTYGHYCREACGHCANDSCNPETGRCKKCQLGWRGDFCKEECPDGLFGENCTFKCGKCIDNMPCDKDTGECRFGCAPGFEGKTCHHTCKNNRYGQNCRFDCGQCYNRFPCNSITGLCRNGCDSGWMGEHCNKHCPPGYFGENCSLPCGKCLQGAPCDGVTGQCIEGCEEGYIGDNCLQALIHQSDETKIGGAVAAVVTFLLILAVVLLIIWRKRNKQKKFRLSEEPESPAVVSCNMMSNSDSKETDKLLKAVHADGPSKECDEEEENEANEGLIQEPIYVNVNLNNKKLTSPIKVEDLYDYIQKLKENDNAGYKEEHQELPRGLFAKCDIARKNANKSKNRYANIMAYDHSRVKLEPLQSDPHSDYINANYIDGYHRTNAYIASQGPNKAMLKDLWRMMWQHKISKIVMLTNLVEACSVKCEQYWPEEGCTKYGDIKVEMIDSTKYTDYNIRTFQISKEERSRVVKQFHFSAWSDHGAPLHSTTLLALRRKVLLHSPDSISPVLVHCSAGIGRSGTYIALDYLIQQAKREGIVDVLGFAQLMRTNRVDMIQTVEQYMFLYGALLEAVKAGETTIPQSAFDGMFHCLQLNNSTTDTTPLQDQYEVMKLLSPCVDREEYRAALLPENQEKNRFRNILPSNRCRPFLYTPVDSCNDYINAVFLSGYTQRDAFLATQMPLPSTVADFWRMLYDYHSDTVVMLNEFDRNDKSCALYWPEEYGYTEEHGSLRVELLSSLESDQHVTVKIFKLSNLIKGEERAIKQFQFKSWPDYKDTPGNIAAILQLHEKVSEWQNQNGKGPVTVHCMNGASKTGLFCSICLLLERLKMDKEIDVFQTVKQLRTNRPQFMESYEQYEFCYKVAQEYLHQTYQ